MSVLIGHAAGDENGKALGGKAGDQTGREVCTRAWYAGGWTDVLRPRSRVTAELMAWACECACANPNIGYDQGQRNTLKDEAVKVGFDLSKITTPCETDCSALMTVCAEAAGLNVAYTTGAYNWKNAPVTQNMADRFMATGAFEHLTGSEYLTQSRLLRRGDVLVKRSGHTAMVLTDGPEAAPWPEDLIADGPSPFGGETQHSDESEEDEMSIEKLLEEMTDAQAYTLLQKAQRHAAKLPLPETWDAAGELREAVALGITDGSAPMAPCTRLEAAVMTKRTILKSK